MIVMKDRQNHSVLQQGFTIVELMIATAVLATMLVLVTVVMVNIGKLYYKGINQARVQDDTRSITDQVAQQLQLTDQPPTTAPGPHSTQAYCIGSVRYTYVVGVQLGVPPHQAPNIPPSGSTYSHVLWRDINPTPGSCFIDPSDPHTVTPVDLTQNTPSAGGTELVPGNSRLTAFCIGTLDVAAGTCTPAPSPFTLTVGIAYGDSDLLCSPSVANSCNAGAATMTQWANFTHGDLTCRGQAGDQFCSTAQLNTTVVQRL